MTFRALAPQWIIAIVLKRAGNNIRLLKGLHFHEKLDLAKEESRSNLLLFGTQLLSGTT